MPASDRPTPVEGADRHRHEERPIPTPSTEAGEEIADVVAVHRQPRKQHDRAGRDQKAGREQRCGSRGAHERLRDVREDDDGERKVGVGGPGLHRRVPQDLLHVQRQQEELREQGAPTTATARWPRQASADEDPHRQQRGCRASSITTNAAPARPSRRSGSRSRRPPTVLGGTGQGVDQQHQPRRHETAPASRSAMAATRPGSRAAAAASGRSRAGRPER